MPFVQRDGAARVCGLYAKLQPVLAEEFLSDDHADVIAYLNPPAPTPEELEQSARNQFNRDKLFRAKCLSDLAFRLAKPPGQLTLAEIAAERDRLAAIYRAL
jgi:hypothetical protein